jgi:apolipoprotein N-acyltransferase
MVSLLLSAISGLFLSTAFAPLSLWFAVPISICIFLYAVTKTRHPFASAFLFAVVFNFFTLSWSGKFVGLVPVVFLVVLQSIFYLPLGFISFKRNRYSRIWLILPILLICDELRSIFPFKGFGWNRLSFSQADSPFRIIASYLGDSALSFIAISLGIALYLLFARAQLLSVAIILACATLVLFLPVQGIEQGSARVLAIQGNVPSLGLDFNDRAQEVFNMHTKQTKLALTQIKTKPDVIIWPENAVDVDPFINVNVGDILAKLAKESSSPIIVGAVLRSNEGPENASIMWNSEGEVGSTYIKRTLTPFGEYIPLRTIAELVSPLAKNVTDFVSGNQPVVHKIGGVFAAPIVCYELINDQNVSSNVENSNLIIVQTNNATFADSGQSRQQLNISRIRAIENNRWVISVSTTGVSAFIDNHGVVKSITEQNTAAYLYSNVALIPDESLAHKISNCSALILIGISVVIYQRKRRLYA